MMASLGSSRTGDFDISLLNTEPTNKVPFTIKYYDSQNKGLSYRFWEEPQTNQYEI